MNQTPASQLLSYLRERLPDMIALLKQFVVTESPSAVPDAQKAMLRLLARELGRLGYTVRVLPGRHTGGHLYARPSRRARRRPVQLLLGHCDTVWPLGTLPDMPPEIDGNIMRGPGVYDMKAGLVQLLFALRALRELRLEPSVVPVVFINSDEEIGSPESTRHVRRLARVAERAFVVEPSLGDDGKLKIARKGVGRFTVIVTGRAAHAGLNPEEGASAILELSYVIQRLFALNDPARGITVNVGAVSGGVGPNVVAPESRAVAEVRVGTHEDARRVEERIRALRPTTPGVTLTVEGRMTRPPMEPTPRNQALWRLARRLAGELGFDVAAGAAGGASDGNTTSLFAATLDGLGAVGGGAHARHEFVYCDKMAERSALLALLLTAPPVPDGRETAAASVPMS
jgi:glutamate carboxypeptidase